MRKPMLRLQLALQLTCALLASACSSSPTNSPPPPVQRAQLPALPQEARQQPAPAWCSPTCTEALTARRKNSLQRLTKPAAEASAASASATN